MPEKGFQTASLLISASIISLTCNRSAPNNSSNLDNAMCDFRSERPCIVQQSALERRKIVHYKDSALYKQEGDLMIEQQGRLGLSRQAQLVIGEDLMERAQIEACGVLLGELVTGEQGDEWRVDDVVPLRNIAES